MCKTAVRKGLTHIAFTEHTDGDYCSPINGYFDYENFSKTIDQARQKYSQLVILKGFEYGEVHLTPSAFHAAASLKPDIIIGSLHRPPLFSLSDTLHNQEYSVDDLFSIYFNTAADMVKTGGFDVLGHLDLPVRYFYTDYRVSPALEKLLSQCVKNEIVPEINTSTLRRGYPNLMPGDNALSMYKDCGGIYIACGSDAHYASDIAADFDSLERTVSYYDLIPVYFKERKMYTMPLECCV